MSRPQQLFLIALAMMAFAGNSLLCRQALRESAIDPASFTTLRLVSGALTLWLIVRMKRGARVRGGSWLSAVALFAYAAGFSFAYTSLTAATGALLLFGAVQATMIGYGVWSRERFAKLQVVGFVVAVAGLISFLVPGLAAPPLHGTLLMLSAGVAWGIYSLRGKGAGDPVNVTTGNFLRAAPMALMLSLLQLSRASIDSAGICYAIASGALTSGIGYVIWYAAMPGLKASHAASVQLSVPVIAAFGGIIFLGESITLRLGLASVAVLGGIALVIADRPS
jgi:drug/metabolite transporter (DMT)-like permease